MVALAAMLKIYFELFLLKKKGQLVRNFFGSIEVTYRLKITTNFLNGNPRWHGRHLENLYWPSSLRPKGQLTRNLSDNQVGDTEPSWPSCLLNKSTFTIANVSIAFVQTILEDKMLPLLSKHWVILTLSDPGKLFSRRYTVSFLISPENFSLKRFPKWEGRQIFPC